MLVKPDYLSLAIQKLRPGSEYKFIEQDYSSIEWFVLEGDAPTQTEIDAAIELVKQQETETQAKRAAALVKLKALGLDEDDLKALGF